jgi:hypothetical protein
MATNTTKLGLIKPDFVDVVDISDLNSNADDIDAAVGFAIVTSSTRPSTPWTGQSIFETDTGNSFIWDGAVWQPGGGGGSIEISSTAPSNPGEGDLWWDSDNGNLYIYYDDGDSQQWVAANGPQVFVGTTAPAGYQGQLWFDSTQGKTYIYYDDGTSAQWVSAIGGSLSGNVIQAVSTVKSDVFSASLAGGGSSRASVTGLTASISPASTNSKILVQVSVVIGGLNFPALLLTRGGSEIALGDSAGIRQRVTGFGSVHDGTFGAQILSFSYLDSPATTSSVTYGVSLANMWAGATATVYVNRSTNDQDGATTPRSVSTITLLEIAG